MGMLIVLAIPIVTTLFFISLLIVNAHSTGPGTDVRQDAALSETEKSRGETRSASRKRLTRKQRNLEQAPGGFRTASPGGTVGFCVNGCCRALVTVTGKTAEIPVS